MSNTDPFEAFKNRREIELLEGRFKARAEEQRKRVDDALAEEDDETVHEDKVNQEMHEFFKESTDSMEKVLDEISNPVERAEIAAALASVNGSSVDIETGEADEASDEVMASEQAPQPLDLRAALDRIRRHKEVAGGGHGDAEDPRATEPVPVSEDEDLSADPSAEPVDSGDFDFEQEAPAPEPGSVKVLSSFEDSFGSIDPDGPAAERESEDSDPESEMSLIEPGAAEEPQATAVTVDTEETPVIEVLQEVGAEPEQEASFLTIPETESEPEHEPEPEPESEWEPEPDAAIESETAPALDDLVREVAVLKRMCEVLLAKGLITAEELEL